MCQFFLKPKLRNPPSTVKKKKLFIDEIRAEKRGNSGWILDAIQNLNFKILQR